ncbi:helix-turn-helix domain-containing protein [Schinkia azotoformans]|nr:helix-turn-helix domain-containing protein [Schinkia azotoformans]
MTDIPEYLKNYKLKTQEKNLKEILEETEKKIIENALKRFNFDKNRAAEALGIGNSTLYDKIKKHQISGQYS